MTRPRTCPGTGRFPGQLSRRTARIAAPLRPAAQLADHSPCSVTCLPTSAQPAPDSSPHQRRRRVTPPPGRRTYHEPGDFKITRQHTSCICGDRTRGDKKSGGSSAVSAAWPARGRRTAGNDDLKPSADGERRQDGRRAHRGESTPPTRTSAQRNAGRRLPPAPGVADRSPSAAAARSRSGARLPAGTAPGSSPGPPPRAGLP